MLKESVSRHEFNILMVACKWNLERLKQNGIKRHTKVALTPKLLKLPVFHQRVNVGEVNINTYTKANQISNLKVKPKPPDNAGVT